MFGKTKAPAKFIIDSLLDAKTTIHGNVTFEAGMQIEGRVHGDVKSSAPEAMLVIGRDAVIEGAVEAANVEIRGTVIGPIKGRLTVSVGPHGNITGDVHYGRIQMEEGAQIRGQLLPVPQAPAAPIKATLATAGGPAKGSLAAI